LATDHRHEEFFSEQPKCFSNYKKEKKEHKKGKRGTFG